jgi:hypothetical protein
MFCFRCKEEKPNVTMKSNGTMVTVTQHCNKCHDEFQWRSQPLVNGKHLAGNIIVSMAVLLAGGSISKVFFFSVTWGSVHTISESSSGINVTSYFQKYFNTGSAARIR